MVIERVYPGQVKILCELDEKIFGREDAFTTPELWDGLDNFFITVNGVIVGSTALRRDSDVSENKDDDYPYIPESLYIVSIGILPRWQGQGIGKQVAEWQIHWASDHGFNRIVMNARESNKRSIGLYQGLGFKRIATIPGYYSEPQEDTVVLELKL